MKQTRAAEYAEDGSIKISCVEAVFEETFRGHYIQSSDVNFISHIDGTHLKSRRDLVNHNRQHGVSNDLDSLREQTARANEPIRLSQRERKNNIADAYERASSSGFSRRVEYSE